MLLALRRPLVLGGGTKHCGGLAKGKGWASSGGVTGQPRRPRTGASSWTLKEPKMVHNRRPLPPGVSSRDVHFHVGFLRDVGYALVAWGGGGVTKPKKRKEF